jgi:CheY-like chemotaxis protein
MPEGGTLTVTTRLMSVETNSLPLQMGELKAGDYVCVSVSDTGHGMSRETQERVFEPFFTTKPRGRGTGLGLSMAYGFVKQSGGAVKIYSELGIGTNVSFFLPVHEPQLPEAAVLQGGATQVVNLNGCTVLLVDDEEDLLEIASAYAEELGCKVLTAIDGQRALEILESPVVVHVMLTDIIMPGGITGAALAQRARILRPELKIVYTSGLPVDALAERKSLALNGPLLRKPYQRADVQAFLRRAMSKDTSSGGTSSA